MKNQKTIYLAKVNHKSILSRAIKDWQLYVFLLPAVLYIFIFHYLPMYGIAIAFENFKPYKGVIGSQWVGMENFVRFFKSPNLKLTLTNTLVLSVYQIIVNYPFSILMALSITYVMNKRYRKVVQSVTYAPHFVSVVVLCSMMTLMFSENSGIVNRVINSLGGKSILFLGRTDLFSSMYVWSDVWQNTGWNSIIYIAALSAVNTQLYEAAMIDGANKFQRIYHIDIPAIIPTMILLLILNCGRILSVGFEKVYLLQNPLNITVSEVISTYVYKQGLQLNDYSYSTAVNLFNTFVNLIILLSVNAIAHKTSDYSLF